MHVGVEGWVLSAGCFGGGGRRIVRCLQDRRGLPCHGCALLARACTTPDWPPHVVVVDDAIAYGDASAGRHASAVRGGVGVDRVFGCSPFADKDVPADKRAAWHQPSPLYVAAFSACGL